MSLANIHIVKKIMNTRKFLSSDIYNDIPELFDEFVDLANEQLQIIENQFLVLEKDSQNDVAEFSVAINDVMRCLHSIKGASSSLELEDMGHLVHIVEDIMNSVRSKMILLNNELIDLFLEAVDVAKLHLEDILQAKENNLQLQGVDTHTDLINRLKSLSSQ